MQLPAQDRVRVRHLILFAKIAILDLVLEIMLPNKQHLGRVSNGCDNARFSVLIDRHWIPLHVIFHQKG